MRRTPKKIANIGISLTIAALAMGGWLSQPAETAEPPVSDRAVPAAHASMAPVAADAPTLPVVHDC